jgi:hypothetical protein
MNAKVREVRDAGGKRWKCSEAVFPRSQTGDGDDKKKW